MTYTLIWENTTSRDMARLVKRDGEPAKHFRATINALANNPKPPGAERYDGTNTYILRAGIYTATYRIDGGNVAVHVLMVRGKRI